jgi:hypothetical protein
MSTQEEKTKGVDIKRKKHEKGERQRDTKINRIKRRENMYM